MNKLKENKKMILCCIVILGVIIVPLLYSFFYLDAFWDPYSRLADLPVAVVNNDKGAVLNGKTVDYGQEMCDELKADGTLKFVFTEKGKAIDGTKGEKYYATIAIPENFSACITSASTTDKQIAEITVTSNEKRNYLATQILSKAVSEVELSVRGKVNSEIVAELCEKLQTAPDQLNTLVTGLGELSEGAGKMQDGTVTLSEGASDLKNGAQTFSNKFGDFKEGVSASKSGAAQLFTGLNSLGSGINKLTEGAKSLDTSTAHIDELRKNAGLLAAKAKTFNMGMISYTLGVDSLLSSTEATSSFMQGYVAANPKLMGDPEFKAFITKMSDPSNAKSLEALKKSTETLKNASAQITQAITLLSDATSGIPELKAGITQLKNGLVSAQTGSAKVVKGSKTLKDGLGTLNDAAVKLSDASAELSAGAAAVNAGSVKLSEGSKKLKTGIDTAKTEVGNNIGNTNKQLDVLNGLAEYAKAPVNINQDAVYPVPNYGTAFAPYFMSLSLWVGALIIFFGIFLDADAKFKLLSRNSDQKVLRSFIYLLIGFVQAILLGAIIKVCLGLQVEHVFLYYLSCCLISLVFISIVQFLLVFAKDIGKFLAIALLILQLTSCGGTFPMETVPKFFHVLYPYMPMTYSVGLLKEAISSVDAANAGHNIFILSGILAVFMTLTILFSVVRKKKERVMDLKAQMVTQ